MLVQLAIAGKRALLLAAAVVLAYRYLEPSPPILAATLAASLVLAVAVLAYRHHRILRARHALESLGGLLALSPAEFEEAVAGILSRYGYRKVRVSGGPADLGVDILAEDRRGRTVIVQCKRHAPGVSVGSGVIQSLLGAVTHHGADRGLVVTTSRFSAPAHKLAAEHGLELIDGKALVEMVRRSNW